MKNAFLEGKFSSNSSVEPSTSRLVTNCYWGNEKWISRSIGFSNHYDGLEYDWSGRVWILPCGPSWKAFIGSSLCGWAETLNLIMGLCESFFNRNTCIETSVENSLTPRGRLMSSLLDFHFRVPFCAVCSSSSSMYPTTLVHLTCCPKDPHAFLREDIFRSKHFHSSVRRTHKKFILLTLRGKQKWRVTPYPVAHRLFPQTKNTKSHQSLSHRIWVLTINELEESSPIKMG